MNDKDIQILARLVIYYRALKQTLQASKEILQFYRDIEYSYKWGVPPETQWKAEKMIDVINYLLQQISNDEIMQDIEIGD